MKTWISLLAVLLVSACALLPSDSESPALATTPTAADWKAHSSRVATLEDWFLKGRLAIRTEQDGWNATLHWRQRGDEYRLRVIAPFGQGTVELIGTEGEEVTLITSENQRYQAPDPESLMEAQLGWSVPVTGLKYWVRGLPQPGGGIEAATPDSTGRISSLDQSGWHIEIDDYTQALDRDLPRKLEMANERLELKLVVTAWETLDG